MDQLDGIIQDLEIRTMKNNRLSLLLLLPIVAGLIISIGIANLAPQVGHEIKLPKTAPAQPPAPRPAHPNVVPPTIHEYTESMVRERAMNFVPVQKTSNICGDQPFLHGTGGAKRGPCEEVTVECFPEGQNPCRSSACMSCRECKIGMSQSYCDSLGVDDGEKWPVDNPPIEEPDPVDYGSAGAYCLAKHELVHGGQDCEEESTCSAEEEAYLEQAKCICKMADKAKNPKDRVDLALECCVMIANVDQMACQIDTGIESGKDCDCDGGGGGFPNPEQSAEIANVGGFVPLHHVYSHIDPAGCQYRIELESRYPDEGVLTYLTPTFVQSGNANSDTMTMSVPLSSDDIQRLASKHLVNPSQLQYVKAVHRSPITDGSLTVEVSRSGTTRAVSSYQYTARGAAARNQTDISEHASVLVQCSGGIKHRFDQIEDKIDENARETDRQVAAIYNLLRRAIAAFQQGQR